MNILYTNLFLNPEKLNETNPTNTAQTICLDWNKVKKERYLIRQDNDMLAILLVWGFLILLANFK